MVADHGEGREEQEGFMQGNAMASFVHLHFGSNPTVAPAFVERCKSNATKAAAVAAASASAVAGAGPVAAAAAGAAAAAAVVAALDDHQSHHHELMFDSPLPIRRSESFDSIATTPTSKVKLVRSGSDVWTHSNGHDVDPHSLKENLHHEKPPRSDRVTATIEQGDDIERPRNGKKYNLDVNRQQLRVVKPLNGKRLPERIVSLLPAATEILLEIGKLVA